MGAKLYPTYRDSGVEWIGDIPEHWEVKKLKNHIESKSDVFVDGDWIESPYITDNGYRLVQTGNVGIGRYKEQGNRYISPETFKQLRCTEVLPDDLLICRLADPVGRACMAPNLGVRMVTSVDVAILRLGNINQHQYLTYFFSSTEYLLYMESVCRGGTRDRVSRSFLGSVFLPSPPLQEQKQIAAFLDRETSKIDTLIEKQQQLINLLKEKRGSLISHTVTKGLNLKVQMKHSGVEWIGDIPEHWEVKAFRTLGQFYGGLTGKAGPDFTDEGPNTQFFIPFTNILNNTYVNWDELKPVQLDPLEKQNKVVSGDLLFLMSSEDYEFLGWSSVAENVPRDVYLNSFCKGFHLSANESPAFINYFNKSVPGRSLIRSVGNGFTRINLRTSALASVKIPSPPLKEQKQIASYLDAETSKIDTLIDKANQSIALLKERRSSLISAAVTGKIDVREAA